MGSFSAHDMVGTVSAWDKTLLPDWTAAIKVHKFLAGDLSPGIVYNIWTFLMARRTSIPFGHRHVTYAQLVRMRTTTTFWNNQGCTERVRRHNASGADKSQHCRKQFLQYSTFASERPWARTWGAKLVSCPECHLATVSPCRKRYAIF